MSYSFELPDKIFSPVAYELHCSEFCASKMTDDGNYYQHHDHIHQLEHDKEALQSINDYLNNELSSLEERCQRLENEKVEAELKNAQIKKDLERIIEERDLELEELRQANLQIPQPLDLGASTNRYEEEIQLLKADLLQTEDKLRQVSGELDDYKRLEEQWLNKITEMGLNLQVEELKNKEAKECHQKCEDIITGLQAKINLITEELESLKKARIREEIHFADVNTILNFGGTADKDCLTEYRLAQVNLLHPIDPAMEKRDEDELILSSKKRIKVDSSKKNNSSSKSNLLVGSGEADNDAVTFFILVLIFFIIITCAILIPKTSFKSMLILPFSRNLNFERTSLCQ